MGSVFGGEEPLEWIRLVVVAMSITVKANAAVQMCNGKIRRVIAKAHMSDTLSGIPKRHNLR
jgi:hypothetical protein